MPLTYIHLSDIHFGQEKGGQWYINTDAKARLIDDVRTVIANTPNSAANGIIISGDIAYAGKKHEYDAAYEWITSLANAANCPPEEVLVVPGNHDIDLSAITPGVQLVINDIIARGDKALDEYLSSDADRELLYHRFADYREFAAGYNCGLDGGGAIDITKKVEVAPGKYIMFYCVNTALICSKNKTEEGSLLLGKKQRVIPTEEGVEVIVVGHHPIHWLQDSEDALKYIKNRARVFISGHEHMPSHKLEEVNGMTHLLSLAAGATAPPHSNETYTFCYNIFEFDWNADSGCLLMKVRPRIWDDSKKMFGADTTHFSNEECIFELKCGKKPKTSAKVENKLIEKNTSQERATLTQTALTKMKMSEDQTLLLRFFKDLNSAQRLEALSKMGAIPLHSSDKVTHTIEVLALRSVFAGGRGKELQYIIEEILSTKKG